MIARLSWTFLPRAPSERLPLYSQRAGENLGSDDRLAGETVIGLSEGNLATKLDRRKHVPGGSKFVRVFVCEDYAPGALELLAPQLFCRVCLSWPAVR